MSVRVVKDGFWHIDDNLGQRLHTQVRALKTGDGRIAVFLSPSHGPAHVYSLDDVVVKPTSGGCHLPVCYGKASRAKLARLWEGSEAAHAV